MIKKKTIKKSTDKKKRMVKKSTEMIPVYVDVKELLKPELETGKYSIIPTPLNQRQIQFIVAPTDSRFIKERPGKGGGTWKYLPGSWFRKRLNFAFGFMWDFDILGERIDGDYITVKGKLTIKDPKTLKPMIEKTDFGGAEVKYLKDTKKFLDISNDFKAAATDCLKRCCVQIGFAMDVYGMNELKDAGYQIQNGQPQHQVQIVSRPPVNAQPVQATLIPNNKKIDYCKKLIDYITKNNEDVTEREVVSFINFSLNTKYTQSLLTDQKQAQYVLARFLQNK